MTFFDILNFCTKKTDLPLNSLEEDQIESLANPYLLQRYLSMASPEHLSLINETTNRWWNQTEQEKNNTFTTKLCIKYFHHVTPRHMKFIKYMKRTASLLFLCFLFTSCIKNNQKNFSHPLPEHSSQKIKYVNPISEDWYYTKKEDGTVIFY